MILPSEVHITKASDLEAQREGKDAAMIRQGAVIGKSDKMCATGKSIVTSVDSLDSETSLFFSSASSWRTGLVTSSGNEDELQRHELSAGDFAFVPPWTEHQEINETDDDVVWILMRTGPEPVVVYLTGWGGDEAKAD
ncbi:cupin domain-containing protein [Whalleya microplaca]|nr:cupin domain-containing protein [Whalleya microplaca]